MISEYWDTTHSHWSIRLMTSWDDKMISDQMTPWPGWQSPPGGDHMLLTPSPDVQIAPDLKDVIWWCAGPTYVHKTLLILSSVFSEDLLQKPFRKLSVDRSQMSSKSFVVEHMTSSSGWWSPNPILVSNESLCFLYLSSFAFTWFYVWQVAYHGHASVDCHITSSYRGVTIGNDSRPGNHGKLTTEFHNV